MLEASTTAYWARSTNCAESPKARGTALGWRHPLSTRLWPGGENPRVMGGHAAEPSNLSSHRLRHGPPRLSNPLRGPGRHRASVVRLPTLCGCGPSKWRPRCPPHRGIRRVSHCLQSYGKSRSTSRRTNRSTISSLSSDANEPDSTTSDASAARRRIVLKYSGDR